MSDGMIEGLDSILTTISENPKKALLELGSILLIGSLGYALLALAYASNQ